MLAGRRAKRDETREGLSRACRRCRRRLARWRRPRESWWNTRRRRRSAAAQAGREASRGQEAYSTAGTRASCVFVSFLFLAWPNRATRVERKEKDRLYFARSLAQLLGPQGPSCARSGGLHWAGSGTMVRLDVSHSVGFGWVPRSSREAGEPRRHAPRRNNEREYVV